MVVIPQTTFSYMKMFEFRLNFQWSLFLRVQLTIFQHWFRKWLGAVEAASHYRNQWWLVLRRIFASPGLNELAFLRNSGETQVPWTELSYRLTSVISCFNTSKYYCLEIEKNDILQMGLCDHHRLLSIMYLWYKLVSHHSIALELHTGSRSGFIIKMCIYKRVSYSFILRKCYVYFRAYWNWRSECF